MGNTVLGVVAPLPQGVWNSTTTYQKLSVVREGNSSYIAKSANVNIQPGVTDSWETYWMLLNEDGDTGQQGPQGETGVGVPDGGLKGDILVKRSQNNYDDEWVDPDNITVGNATKALKDENGNNIADTYQTKQDSTDQNTALQTQITSNTQGITKNSQLISRNSARLTNVEQRISPSPFVKDSTVAYVKDVPANALPYAELQKLGGMTYRVNLGTDDAPNYVLRSASVTSVEIVGANLWSRGDVSGVTNTTRAISLPAGSYTMSCFITSSDTDYTSNRVTVNLADGTNKSLFFERNKTSIISFTVNSDIVGFTFAASSSNTPSEGDSFTFANIMLNKGSTALPYAPYTKSTLPIPESVHALDGYGEGVNESVYNYITWNPEGNVKTYTKAVKAVDMGTIDWVKSGSGAEGANLYVKTFDDIKVPTTSAERRTGFLCAKYNPAANITIATIENKAIMRYSEGRVYVRDDDYADAASFKAAMAGVMLYYELATPEITDISALITADNMLPVQGNGTITFVNEYGYDVPSTVEYMT